MGKIAWKQNCTSWRKLHPVKIPILLKEKKSLKRFPGTQKWLPRKVFQGAAHRRPSSCGSRRLHKILSQQQNSVVPEVSSTWCWFWRQIYKIEEVTGSSWGQAIYSGTRVPGKGPERWLHETMMLMPQWKPQDTGNARTVCQGELQMLSSDCLNLKEKVCVL